MIIEQYKILKKIVIFADICVVAVAFVIGYLLRDKINDIYPISSYIGLLPILILIWVGLLYYFGMYGFLKVKKIPEVLFVVLKTAVIGFILFGSYIFIINMHTISRLFIVFTFIIAASLITAERLALIFLFRSLVKRGPNFKASLFVFRSILIVGTGKRAKLFIDLINNNPDWGITIVGLVDADPAKKGEIINGHKIIGDFTDIPEIIHKNIVDEVVFVVPRSWLGKIEDIMHFCENEGLSVNLAVDFFELKLSKSKLTNLYGFPLLTFESTPSKLWHLFLKRLFDFVFSGIALILLIPLFAIVAIIIKATSKGPIFFKQKRCSIYGRWFILYKFRTMVVDAEAKLKDIISYNEMEGPVFKMKDDPRIIKAGKFLRKFSIDELPQLWNVFKGDMSMVGPRPPLPSEVENYDNWQRRKLSMRPGVTCLWQVSGRNKINDFNEWMRLDLEYIDNWSLGLDVKIFFKTILVVIFAIGAE